jgi:hypothetical protein
MKARHGKRVMVLEMLSVVAVVVFVILKIENALVARAQREALRELAALQAQQAAFEAAVPTETALRIEGATPLPPRDHRRLARFGLRPDRAHELHVFTSDRPIEDWPAAVVRMLRRLYQDGRVRGPGIADVVFGARRLLEGQGLYFALLDADDAPAEVLAFVDTVA